MLSLITKLSRKEKIRSKISKIDLIMQFKNDFFTKEHHYWINENKYIKGVFEDLFDLLPEKILQFFIDGPPLLFLISNGRYSCALSVKNSSVIVVFPELMKLLKSPATYHAMAILAHEIGHIYLEHGHKDIDPLKAQIEADKFASDLGLGHQIESFLNDLEECTEKRVRICYLASRNIADSYR